jgi:hypothetical protein
LTCPRPAQTTQYDRHEVRCACGRVHVADAPPRAGAPGTVTYGPNFQAWCAFLMVMHHVPVERCADILESMSGTRPSDGWVHSLLGHAARAVAAANKTILALIILASVICGDETPLRAGPGPKIRKKYLQVACTNLLTYYYLGDRDLASNRTRPAAIKDPAEDLRPAPLGENHPRPVRHPGLRLHRRQARDRRLHRHPRCPHRKPLDTTHPGQRLNHARNPSRTAIQE